MRALRLRLRLYVGGVIAAAALALVGGAVVLPAATDDLAVGAVLLVLATAAQLRPVHLSPKMKVTVEDAATFAASLLLGPLPAMVVAGGSTLVAGLLRNRRMSFHNRAFNASVRILDGGITAVAYGALAGGRADVVVIGPAILGAALVKLAINLTLVDIAVGLQVRRPIFAKWWYRHHRDTAQYAALYLIGALGAVAASHSALALVLFIAPSALVLLTLRNAARLEKTTKNAIRTLAGLIQQRDEYTYGHSQRVAGYAERLAQRMGMEQTQIDLIREAALLHDIGKVGTPDRVLLKPASLDDREREEMHRHADFGYSILEKLPDFWEGADFVRSHHERVDGTGYPRGLRGTEVPQEVSVIAVADSYDAMTTDRVYRKALPWDVVRSELIRERGRQWHELVVDTFLAMIEEERAATRVVASVA